MHACGLADAKTVAVYAHTCWTLTTDLKTAHTYLGLSSPKTTVYIECIDAHRMHPWTLCKLWFLDL